jgi:flavin reductase (DIM6/NTAB) family NADH-FMN oxidoreductase RutF
MTIATATPTIDQVHFRSVMGHLPTAVVALSGFTAEGQRCGLVVGTFASLSLEPALVTFSVGLGSTSWPKLRPSNRLTASVLADGQEAVCGVLSSKRPDKFDEVEWFESADGLPRLAGAHAWIDCEVETELDGGDHVIVIARVLDMDAADGRDPLIFHKGRLGGLRSLQDV